MIDANQKVPAPGSDQEIDSKQLLKMLVELGPLVVFFIANAATKSIFWGTGAFMLATAIALFASRALFGRLPIMPMISGVFVLFFGGLTLWLQDALFIKVKPTIVNTLFALILLGGLAFGQSLLRHVLGDVFKLTAAGWRILTLRWAMFFLVLALLNEVVWRNFSEEFWIAFKMVGVMPLTIIFGVAQLRLLRRHASSETTL